MANKHISHIKSNVSVNCYVSKTDSSVVITPEQYEALSSSEQENYILKTGPKLPSASDILYGEIAINYKDDIETLSIKNDNNEIVEFASKKYVSELVPTPTSLDTDKFLKGNGTWATPPSTSYPKGSAEDLNTGSDTTEKVWDAKTIADYVQDNTAAATKFKNGFNAGTGAIDGGSTTLTSVSEKIGDMYTVTTAGTFAGKDMQVGDSIIFKKAVAKNTAPTANDVVYVEGAVSVTNTGNTLDWNTDVTVATVEGVNITSKLPANPNTDRYVNSADFADDTTTTPASPVKMTLTRAGSDSATVTANLPKVSSASAGVVPKGEAVETQSQSTKFLREDGTWAAPSYTQSGGDVTGPSSSTDAHVAVFDGVTGKVIKDSSFTIGKSVPSDAVFTDNNTTYTFADGTSGDGTFTVTPSGGNAQTVTVHNVQSKVSALGSTTKPVYTSVDGTFSECSTYAGGTAVTLNGTSKGGNSASFYAPTSAGTNGQILTSNGSGEPSWTSVSLPSEGNAATLSTGTSTTANTWSAKVLNDAIGTGATTATSISSVPISNRVVAVTISSGSAGSFSLATGLTKGREVHVIVKNTGSSYDYTITIPHSPTAASGYKYVNTVDNAQGNAVVPKSSGGYVEINALYDGTYVYLRYA